MDQKLRVLLRVLRVLRVPRVLKVKELLRRRVPAEVTNRTQLILCSGVLTWLFRKH